MRTINIRGQFTREEDQILKSALNKYGKNWAVIAKKWFKGRTAKQLRDHFTNTINKSNNVLNKINHQYTINMDNENDINGSPVRANWNNVQIEVSSFADPNQKCSSTKKLYNKAITREFVLRQQTTSSIFTDESLKEEMKGTDQSWYNNLNSKRKNYQNVENYSKDLTKLGSNDQYKQMMSSSSNNSQSGKNMIIEENVDHNENE